MFLYFHFFTICLAFIMLQTHKSNVNYFTIFISRFLLETANAMFRLEQFHLVTMISDQITGQDWQGRNLTATESDLEIKSNLILSEIGGGLSMHIQRTDNNNDKAALTFSP